jgi:hypothetical protein
MAHSLVMAGENDARGGAQARQGLDDQREARCKVVARSAVELDALVLFARDDPDAVVFGFMPPIDALLAEYEAWQNQQGLELGSASEGIPFDETLTAAQRTWLRDFAQRWESASRVHCF